MAASASDKAVNNPTSRLEKQYKQAKDIYYTLEREEATRRAQWLKGIHNFRRVYLAAQQSNLAPSCLYMVGRMYRRMYEQFHVPLDIDEAINSFKDVATLFPGSTLADGALFSIAEIERIQKHNPQQAAQYYQQLIAKYPNGDKRNQAYSQLQTITKDFDLAMPEHTVQEQIGHDLVTLEPVQHWSSTDYTRIVIRGSGPVHYSTRLLEKNNQLPRRLIIDFDQSYIAPEARTPVPIEDGLLQQVQTEQVNETTARLILDIESVSDYKIFNLNDPFRVIIDVRGIKKERGEVPGTKRPKVVNTPEKTVAQSSSLPGHETSAQPEQLQTAPDKETIITLEDRKKTRPQSLTSPVSTGQHHTQRVSESLSLAQQLGLGIRRIVVDPGHGGKDPGAMANHLQEKDIVLSVARRTAKILREKYHYDVILTRKTDVFIPLEERTAIANTNNADLFVSIHVNAHPKKNAKGVETFYLNLATNSEAMRVAARENATSTHNISELQDILSSLMQNAKIKESSRLAEAVQKTLIHGLGKKYSTRNLGVKQAPFYVLIGAEMPAILSEISFITNPAEAKRLKDVKYLQTIAEQIAAGVDNFSKQRRTASL